jgi:hypothetical protein
MQRLTEACDVCVRENERERESTTYYVLRTLTRFVCRGHRRGGREQWRGSAPRSRRPRRRAVRRLFEPIGRAAHGVARLLRHQVEDAREVLQQREQRGRRALRERGAVAQRSPAAMARRAAVCRMQDVLDHLGTVKARKWRQWRRCRRCWRWRARGRAFLTGGGGGRAVRGGNRACKSTAASEMILMSSSSGCEAAAAAATASCCGRVRKRLRGPHNLGPRDLHVGLVERKRDRQAAHHRLAHRRQRAASPRTRRRARRPAWCAGHPAGGMLVEELCAMDRSHEGGLDDQRPGHRRRQARAALGETAVAILALECSQSLVCSWMPWAAVANSSVTVLTESF